LHFPQLLLVRLKPVFHWRILFARSDLCRYHLLRQQDVAKWCSGFLPQGKLTGLVRIIWLG
jgi:hypothetical protein